MLKFGDSMYRCKCLKRSGLGQFSSSISKLKNELIYLEQVRQHLLRLPSIDPFSRTIIVAGFPNVGKSSFISAITKCKSEVQPYPFTTTNLFVGHFEHNLLNYQIIDTPGLLDSDSLENRSKTEMLSITALAHLKSTLMFFIDVSSTCVYSIEKQIELFNSISPLITSQHLIVLSKSDLIDFSIENHDSLNQFLQNKKFVVISTKNNLIFHGASVKAQEMILDARNSG